MYKRENLENKKMYRYVATCRIKNSRAVQTTVYRSSVFDISPWNALVIADVQIYQIVSLNSTEETRLLVFHMFDTTYMMYIVYLSSSDSCFFPKRGRLKSSLFRPWPENQLFFYHRTKKLHFSSHLLVLEIKLSAHA